MDRSTGDKHDLARHGELGTDVGQKGRHIACRERGRGVHLPPFSALTRVAIHQPAGGCNTRREARWLIELTLTPSTRPIRSPRRAWIFRSVWKDSLRAIPFAPVPKPFFSGSWRSMSTARSAPRVVYAVANARPGATAKRPYSALGGRPPASGQWQTGAIMQHAQIARAIVVSGRGWSWAGRKMCDASVRVRGCFQADTDPVRAWGNHRLSSLRAAAPSLTELI